MINDAVTETIMTSVLPIDNNFQVSEPVRAIVTVSQDIVF